MLNYYFPEGATPMLARIVTTNMSQPNFPHMLFNIRTVTIMKWNINRQYLATCTTHPHPLCTNRQPQRPSNYFDRLEIYISTVALHVSCAKAIKLVLVDLETPYP